MPRKSKILFAAAAFLLALIILVVCLLPSAPPDPVYNGKTLSAWIEQYETNYLVSGRADTLNNTNIGIAMNEAAEVLRQNRTSAIPILLRKIATKDLALERFAEKILSTRWAIRVGLTERWNDQAMHTMAQRQAGRMGFHMLGTNALSAVPDLIRVKNTNPNPDCRMAARVALVQVDPGNPALKIFP